MRRYCLPSLVFTFTVCVAGFSQGQGLTQTTVQLPTFHYFGTSTTVVVPDRGTVSLGGVGRSSLGSRRYSVPLGGPALGGRAYGRSRSVGGVSIRATVHDFEAMDRAVLAEAARRRGARFDVLGRPLATRRSPVASRGVAAESQRAATYLQRGRAAEAQGEPHMAMVFYRRVVKHGTDAEKQQARERLAALKALVSKKK